MEREGLRVYPQDSCHWYCNTDLCNHGLMGEMPNSAATNILRNYIFLFKLVYSYYLVM